MRKLNGLIFISALAMACSTVSAQMRIVIDGQQIPTEHIASIVILPNTNEINVSTTVDYTITAGTVVSTGVAINSFTSSAATVLAGQTLSFNWNTSNAESCEATNGVDGWAGSAITLPSGGKAITTATLGTHTFTLTCNGAEVGDTATRNVVVNTTPADAVSISSFTATPDSISEGGTTSLSWTTVNASSCTPTGGSTDWTSQTLSLPSGSANVSIDSAGTYTFSLVCQGPSGDQQTRSDVVTVTPGQQSCDSVTLAGNTVNWSSFWYQAFPGPVYENVTNYIIPRLGYLAIEFNTANIIDDGKISALENSATPGIRTGSISTCQGDFDVPAECRYTWGLGGGLSWSTNGKLGACALDSNTTYYFNITFTDGVDSGTSTCNTAPCRINLQHYNF
jgi:hypothetical protein